MARFAATLQDKLRASSAGIATFVLKVLSGFILGLTFALIGEQALDYGSLSFFFVVTVSILAFLKISKSWNWILVMVFDLVLILLGLLLRMYILVAPGA